MATRLKGTPALRRRMRAIGLAFKPIGAEWAETAADLGNAAVPVRTGRLRTSHRKRNATMKRATVVAHFTSTFVDGGTAPHRIEPKRAGRLRFQEGGRTIFARKVNHPGARAQPYKERVAREALRRTPMADILIKEWNEAA